MSPKYRNFLKKMISIVILFCSLAFGQKNGLVDIPAKHNGARDIHSGRVLTHSSISTLQSFPDDGNSNTTPLIGCWANGPCYAVDVSGNIAYFGNGSYLEVVDISDPSNPNELGKLLTPSIISGVAVSGTYAYVADGNDGM